MKITFNGVNNSCLKKCNSYVKKEVRVNGKVVETIYSCMVRNCRK